MKALILPALTVLLGVGSAFATQNAKQDAKAIVPGYRLGGVGEQACVRTPQNCETVNTGDVCTWFDGTTMHNLKQLNDSECVVDLYEIKNP